MARHYGCRPSSFYPELEPAVAYLVDRVTFVEGSQAELEASEAARHRAEFEAKVRAQRAERR